MQIYTMSTSELRSLSLPGKVSGQHILEYTAENGDIRTLLRINAKDEQWYIAETSQLEIRDAQNPDEQKHEYALYENAIFFLRLKKKHTVILMAVPESPERSLYAHYKIPEGRVIDIGQADFNQISYGNEFINARRHLRIRYAEDGMIYIGCCDDDIPAHLRTPAYLNHDRIRHEMKAAVGDCVFLFGLKVVLGKDFIAVNNPNHEVSVQLEKLETDLFIPDTEEENEEAEDYEPKYFSSAPREKREVITRKFEIENPPEDVPDQDIPWIVMMGPSITMAMGSVLSSGVTINNVLSSGGNIYTALPSLVTSIVMVLGSVIWPVVGRRIQNRARARKAAIAYDDYTNYLKEVSRDIEDEKKLQREILIENNPSVEACIEKIEKEEETLWERSQRHNDFLTVQIGTGDVPLDAELSYQKKGYESCISMAASDMHAVLDQDHFLKDVPVTIPLKGAGVVGITGDRSKEISFAKALLLELTALHNYEDLKIFFIYNEKERKEWEFVKWIPHLWNNEQTFRFLANDPDEVRNLSDYISRLLVSKRGREKENRRPYYLVFAADRILAERAQALKEFYSQSDSADMTVLALYDEREHLPKECSFVIDLMHDQNKDRVQEKLRGAQAVLSDYNDITGKRQLCRTRIGFEGNPEKIFIKMSNIRLDSAYTARVLPTEYTFLEMLGAGKPEHLDISRRWKENSAVEAIRAPIGIDADGYLIHLDLHEKAHGPHGCIAGMTGSGKSEFIISMIASLAINYSPEDVAFVLIDFKGGGMADIFKNLPHTAGLITNLDGNELRRSLLALEHELEKRQKLFKEISEKKKISNIDIYKYQKLRRTDPSLAPLPHLILISDEFAELKQQQGDFMGQLIRIARIGRSLGVHLILATQKPEGVVDEQIKSNIRFKVCLKVQERGDSQSMIGRPDATLITNSGRFYFQVGNDEVFEYGQSPWSGALYEPMDHVRKNKADSIEVLNEQGMVICRQAIPKKKRPAGLPEKQIDAVVAFIRETADKDGLRAEKLWLNSLPAPKAVKRKTTVHDTEIIPFVLNPTIGKYDDLLQQKHLPLTLPFTREGNALLYGAGGSGQLDFLIRMMVSLMSHHSPKEVKMYLLDFDEGTLAAFEGSPYIGSYAGMGESQTVRDIIMDLMQQLSERRELMRRYGGEYQTYVRTSGKTVPNLLLVIHNYQNFEEYYSEARTDISKLAREGNKFGIHLILTGTAENSIPYSMKLLFRNIYTLYQNSDEQYRDLVGRTEGIVPAHVKGRGLVRVDNAVCEFQTDIPFEDSDNKYDAIQKYCSETEGVLRTVSETTGNADKAGGTAGKDCTQEEHSAFGMENVPLAMDAGGRTLIRYDFTASTNCMIVYDDQHLKLVEYLKKRICNVNQSVIDLLPEKEKAEKAIDLLWHYVDERGEKIAAAKENAASIPVFDKITVLVESPGLLQDVISKKYRSRLIAMIKNLTSIFCLHFVIVERTDNIRLSFTSNCLGPVLPFRRGLIMAQDIQAHLFFDDEIIYKGNARNPSGYIVEDKEARLVNFLDE